MNNKLISIGIVCLVVFGGFTGLLNLSTMNVKGMTIVSGIAYDGLVGPIGGPWTVVGSPYTVVGDVTVPAGETLTIEPGVEVKFDGYYSIFVDGTLIAVGTETNNVNITSNMAVPEPGDWNRIQINSMGCAEIKYCNISYSQYGLILGSSLINKITNNHISNNKYGISISSSSNNNLTGNNLLNNQVGINLYSSSNNNITNNRVSSNGEYGIYLTSSSNNNLIICNNVSSNNNYGIYLEESSHNHIIGNDFVNDGVVISGNQLSHFNSHNIPVNNTVNGKPLYYYKDCDNINIDGKALNVGQLILANCTDFDVKNLQINNTDVGIEVAHSKKILITGNNISNNTFGIYLILASNNTIANNNISSNWMSGIYLGSSTNNNIINNNVSSNNWDGIWLDWSSSINQIMGNNASNNRFGIHLFFSLNNTITNNNFSNNMMYGIDILASSNNNIISNIVSNNRVCGIHFFSSEVNMVTNNNISTNDGDGINLSISSNNNLTGNNILNNQVGINLYSSSNDNIISSNTFSSNGWYGIWLDSSVNNHIYHNNIIDNVNQAYDATDTGNQWDNGYPYGGNYWSDYRGVDNFKGPNQDIIGSDGIGDTKYSIDLDSADRYPLVKPCKALENYTILKQGWNLISVPIIQEEQNLTLVLGSIDGWYDAVQWYDITDTSDPWKHYKVGKPFGNDLFKINETMGFWIHITQPGDTIFLYNGTQPKMNQTITLHPGWNLVGYPSLTSYNRTEVLSNLTFGFDVDSIWTYNTTTQKWEKIGPSDYFERGRGYWFHSKVEKVWDVPL